jgi:thioredoxin-dependent peroxiredoxin
MEYILIGIVVVATLLVIAINVAQRGEPPKPNTRAPEFCLAATDDNSRSLPLPAAARDWVVMLFFPQDDTPECQSTLKTFSDTDFAGVANRWLVAVTRLEDAKPYAAAHAISLPILADSNGSVSRKYGVLTNVAGFKFARKTLLFIDPRGIVAYSRPVTEDGHIVEAAKMLPKLMLLGSKEVA